MQLKPRNQAHPVRGRVPLLAVCDYKQVEVRARPSGRAPWEGPGRVGRRHSCFVMTLATVGDRAQRGRVSAGGPCTAIPLEGAQQLWQ